MNLIYAYNGCGGCRKALKWLDEKGVAYTVKAIRETPPTRKELKLALKGQAGNLRKLFNVAGGDYRALGLKDKLPQMSEEEAFALLESNGNLVKRPLLLTASGATTGFDEAVWSSLLGV
jgi:arsenate reductase